MTLFFEKSDLSECLADNLDAFTKGCPMEGHVRSCRKWAADVEAGDCGLHATAYAFAVRQLKFPTVNHELAIAVADAASRRILGA